MPKKEIGYKVISEDELDALDLLLLQKAKDALPYSHSPYSQFRVSSVVLLQNGEMITGTNQENAAYPSGLCAERVALSAAKANSDESISTIMVIAESSEGYLANAYSCGNCRQVMMEYAGMQPQPIRILMRLEAGDFLELQDVTELLPFHFSADSLK
jgi:cytidine deaminase